MTSNSGGFFVYDFLYKIITSENVQYRTKMYVLVQFKQDIN